MKKHFYCISDIKKIVLWLGARRSALAFATERQTLERWASLIMITNIISQPYVMMSIGSKTSSLNPSLEPEVLTWTSTYKL
jgi:hypothetical protein